MKRFCIEYFILPIFVMIGTVLCAQTVAEQDPHWQIDWQDDFHIFNPSIWEAKDNFDHWAAAHAFNQSSKLVYINNQNNVRVQGGSLILQSYQQTYSCPQFYWHPDFCSYQDTIPSHPPYAYTSGWVQTKNTNLQYGLVEARIKVSYGMGLNSAFWMIRNQNQPWWYYSEIDFFEMIPGTDPNNSQITHNQNRMSSNIHWSPIPNNPLRVTNYATNTLNDYTQWHIYSLEWTPNYIKLYVDGLLIRNEVNFGNFEPMQLIYNVGLTNHEPNSGTFPSKMEIDWIRWYKLKKDCNAPMDYCSYNFQNHDNKVKKYIRIGGSGCSNILTSKTVLKAKEDITIFGAFEVPLGTGLDLDVRSCY